MVEIGREFSPGLAYVALSRVRTIEGLSLKHELSIAELEEISAKNKSKLKEYERLRNLYEKQE